jgi:quinol monooxygenase YgiN
MYVVLVIVRIRPELASAFESALCHNAQQSVALDPGCTRFDVSQDVTDPLRWVLHEVYEAPGDHARHRQSEHFQRYDRVAAEAVVEKTVIKAQSVHRPDPSVGR